MFHILWSKIFSNKYVISRNWPIIMSLHSLFQHKPLFKACQQSFMLNLSWGFLANCSWLTNPISNYILGLVANNKISCQHVNTHTIIYLTRIWISSWNHKNICRISTMNTSFLYKIRSIIILIYFEKIPPLHYVPIQFQKHICWTPLVFTEKFLLKVLINNCFFFLHRQVK